MFNHPGILMEVKDHGVRFVILHHEMMSIKYLVCCSTDAPYITCCSVMLMEVLVAEMQLALRYQCTFHLFSVLYSTSLSLKINYFISQEIPYRQLQNLVILRVLVTKGDLVLFPVLVLKKVCGEEI